LIDSLRGPGTFDEYSQLDPNNVDRISLPWTQAEVANIFKKLRTEYQKAMDKFTMGTGGGTGAPEGFSVWENRHEAYVVNYDVQPCNIYLSLVYMWDKQYGYCFVDKKDQLPPDCAIGDGWTGDHDDDNDDEMDNNNGNSDDGDNDPTLKTPRKRLSGKKQSTSNRKSESNMMRALDQLVSSRKKTQSSAGELVTLMKERQSNTNDNKSEGIVAQIDKATAVQDNYKKKIEELRSAKHAIIDGTSSTEAKKKKVASIVDEIKQHKLTMKTLGHEITQKREKLQKILGKDDIEVSSESGMDSD
jgi:hypothetical protein